MERERYSDEAEISGSEDIANLSAGLSTPGLEEFLTSDVILDLLKIPKDGLVRISAALFFLGHDETFAFYWRDAQDGEQHCKLLSAEAVRTAFHPMPFDSGWMPPGTLRLGIDRTGRQWLSISIPSAHYHLAIVDSDLGVQEVHVPLPGFIFTGCGRNYWIWAIKDGQASAHTEVYHAPLSNVDSDGLICFGANQPPEASCWTILQAFHLFIGSPFNGHLASSKSRKHQGDIRYLLEELAVQEAPLFPQKDLVAITSHKYATNALTLNLLLNHVIHLRR